MFIGSREETDHLGYLAGVCPKCGKEGAFSVYNAKRKLTLYVLASLKVGEQVVVECSSCHVRFAIPDKDLPAMRERMVTADKLAELMMGQGGPTQLRAQQASQGPTLYQLLQVDPHADPDVIDAAYKRIALKHHPDRDKSPEAVSTMQTINEAKRVLSDPDTRARYDRAIGIQPRPIVPPKSAGIRSDDV